MSKNLKQLVKQGEERPKDENTFFLDSPTSWGLKSLDPWIHLVDDEHAGLAKELATFDERKHQDQQQMESKWNQDEQRVKSTGDSVLDQEIDLLKTKMLKYNRLALDQKWFSGLLLRCTHSVGFFNIDKIFGFPVEALQVLVKTGEDGRFEPQSEVQSDPQPSLIQRFNAPTKLVTKKPDPKNNSRPRKRLPAIAAVEEMKRHCRMISVDARAIIKSISDDYSKAICLPETIYAYGQVIPNDLPKYIRQSLSDLAFLREEMFAAHPLVLEQRDLVRCTMMLWIGSSDATWKWGKEHIYDMPDFQKYEYMRLDMYAMYELTFREEEKLVEYFLNRKKDASAGTTATLEELLKVGKLSKAERKAVMEKRYEDLREIVGEIDVMVQQLDDHYRQIENDYKKDLGGEWWKDLLKMLPTLPL